MRAAAGDLSIPLEGDLLYSPAGERYSAIIDRILDQTQSGLVLVTSFADGEGKTTTAANLALAFHARRISVLLAELPSRRPALEHLFGSTPSGSGLESVLSGRSKLEEVLCKRNDNGMMLAMVSSFNPEPERLAPGMELQGMLDAVRGKFDFAVFDGPSISESTGISDLARAFDVVLMVVRRRSRTRTDMNAALRLLDHPRSLVILNG
ncbi:MAG TPA: hypothetical protein VGD59_03945 [Acidisarcina sp.]